MAITSTIWELEPHTRAKHVILRKYLNAWLPKLTRWNGRVIICDGFAGPGAYKNGEDGSPVIAIKAYLEHSYQSKIKAQVVYWFIEIDKRRCEALEQIVMPYRGQVPDSVTIKVRNTDCDTALSTILDYFDENARPVPPTFAFIDPFGIKGVTLSTLSRLMAHKSCEVFVTFMMTSVQRFLETKELQKHCDGFFGSSDWRNALPMSGVERENYLRALYQRRLHDPDGVGAKYVRFFTMKDESNVTIYDLFFATNSPKGIDAMKAAMWNVDKGGTYTFSDATDPRQSVLFSSEPDWDQLIGILAKRFAGTMQTWPTVEEAIRDTPFRSLKTPIKNESNKTDGRLEIVNPPNVKGNPINENSKIRFRSC